MGSFYKRWYDLVVSQEVVWTGCCVTGDIMYWLLCYKRLYGMTVVLQEILCTGYCVRRGCME